MLLGAWFWPDLHSSQNWSFNLKGKPEKVKDKECEHLLSRDEFQNLDEDRRAIFVILTGLEMLP
jgi:hypothetical protein